jgi:hypothetical protein
MSLSVCCATSEPGPQVAALLAQLRPVADEIVVAVDDRLDPDRLGHFAGVADRLFRFEFGGFVERSLPWLHAQCEADWILHIDGDEVASPALVARLPELTVARDVVQYFIGMRWLFPDEGHWIDQRPWFFYTNRLVRNDPATMWIPGIAHVPAAPVGPTRYVDEPLYHLTCLLMDTEQRAEKVRRYEQLDRSLKQKGSDDDLLQFYLPEITGNPDPVPVPEADREAIRSVLRARGPEVQTPPGLVVPHARLVDTDSLWPERHLPEEAYVASIEVVERDLRPLGAGEHRPFDLRVANGGTTSWPGGDDRRPLIRVAYRWLLEDGTVIVPEGYRTPLPAALAPGDDCLVSASVAGPDVPGRYILEFDLVHELVRWFDCPVRVPLEVRGGRDTVGLRTLVAGWFSFETGHATAGDLLARDVACEWLEQIAQPYHVAFVPPFSGDVDWRQVDPADYSHVVFVCGPFENGDSEREFLGRFSGCRLIGLNLTMLLPLEVYNPFEALVERDSSVRVNPDLVWGSHATRVPVVGVCLVEDYEAGLTDITNKAIQKLVESREISVVPIDTRLDTNSTGLRSPAEIESLIARMDAVITTRLHGTVLALKNGVPALAIDPEAGGAKILRQTRAVGWNVAFTVDDLSDEALQKALDYCLTDEARNEARACRERAAHLLERVREEFLAAFVLSRRLGSEEGS